MLCTGNWWQLEKKIGLQLDRRNQLLPAAIWSRLQCTASGENSRDEPWDFGFPLIVAIVQWMQNNLEWLRKYNSWVEFQLLSFMFVHTSSTFRILVVVLQNRRVFLFSHTLESYEPVFVPGKGHTIMTKPHKGNILFLVRVIQYPADSPVRPYFLSPDENINLLRSSNSINIVNCIYCLYRKPEG